MPLSQRKNTGDAQKRSNVCHDLKCDAESTNSVLFHQFRQDTRIVLLMSVGLQCNERRTCFYQLLPPCSWFFFLGGSSVFSSIN